MSILFAIVFLVVIFKCVGLVLGVCGKLLGAVLSLFGFILSIARAVAGEPKILLLDEITANLDAETEEMVLRALKSASEGRTVISISHRVYQKDGTGRLITVYG